VIAPLLAAWSRTHDGQRICGLVSMDLRQLRYFVHVANLKSFSHAAAHLNVAQSALSRHMGLLESELGVRLLDRHGRGAEPTAAGKVLLKRATRVLRSVDETREAVIHAGQGPAGQVSLAIPPSVSSIFAAPLFKACERELPHVTLKLSEGWTGDIMEWLLIGHNDLGIIYSSQVDDRVCFKSIATEKLALVGSSSDASLKDQTSFTLRDVSRMPLIVPPGPHGLRKVIESAFAEHDLTPQFAYESQVWSVIKEIIRSGLACSILALSEVEPEIRRGHMVSVPIIEPEIKRTLGVALTSNNQPSPPVEAIFEMLGRDGPKWCAVQKR